MGGKWSNFTFAYFQQNPRDSFCQYSLPLGILCSHFANWWRRMVFLTKLVQSWHLNCFKLPFRVHSSWELVVEKMQQFYFYFFLIAPDLSREGKRLTSQGRRSRTRSSAARWRKRWLHWRCRACGRCRATRPWRGTRSCRTTGSWWGTWQKNITEAKPSGKEIASARKQNP